MKIKQLTLLVTGLLLPVNAVASSSSAPLSPDSVTSKLRRAASALEDALIPDLYMVEADPGCHAPGGACDIAKREAIELLGQIGDAHAAAAPEVAAQADKDTPDNWCELEGKPCYVVRGQQSATIDTLDGKDVEHQVIERREEETEEDAAKILNCYRTDGGPCLQARFDFLGNNILTDKFRAHQDEKPPTAFSKLFRRSPGWRGVGHNCGRVGQVCYKVRRAQEMIMDLASDDNIDDAYVTAHVEDLDNVEKRDVELDQPAEKLALAKLRRAVMKMREARK